MVQVIKRHTGIVLLILAAVAIFMLVVAPDWIVAGPPVGALSSDKYDGDCTGTETAGRCADKCPAGDFVRGYDGATGAAICGHVTGCPYGDSIPLGPECDKVSAEQAGPAIASPAAETSATAEPFTGK